VQQSPITPLAKLRQVVSASTHATVTVVVEVVTVVVVLVVVVVVVADPAVQMLSIQKVPSVQKPRFSSWLQFSPACRTFWQKKSLVGSDMRGVQILPVQQDPREEEVSLWKQRPLTGWIQVLSGAVHTLSRQILGLAQSPRLP